MSKDIRRFKCDSFDNLPTSEQKHLKRKEEIEFCYNHSTKEFKAKSLKSNRTQDGLLRLKNQEKEELRRAGVNASNTHSEIRQRYALLELEHIKESHYIQYHGEKRFHANSAFVQSSTFNAGPPTPKYNPFEDEDLLSPLKKKAVSGDKSSNGDFSASSVQKRIHCESSSASLQTYSFTSSPISAKRNVQPTPHTSLLSSSFPSSINVSSSDESEVEFVKESRVSSKQLTTSGCARGRVLQRTSTNQNARPAHYALKRRDFSPKGIEFLWEN